MSLAGKFTDVLTDGQSAHLGGHVHVDSVSTHAPPGAIIVPDAHLLFTGDFKRSGVDLILSSEDRELVLHDYFKGEKRAALASSDGAHLTGDLVNALTGHTLLAQADGSPSVAQVIGHVTKLVGAATAIRNGVSIILNNGDNVNKGDVVQAGSDSTLGITFIDGSVFGLGSNAKMVLNEMIYDPNGSNNSSLISLVQGTISFVAGGTAKKGDMKVDTPVATMGIRGTAVLVEIDFVVPGQGGAPPAKFQVLVEPDGTTGSYILFDKTTLTPIATVNQAGTQTIVNGQGTVNFLSNAPLSPDAQKIISDVFALKFTDLNNPQSLQRYGSTPVSEQLIFKTAIGQEIPVTLKFAEVVNTSGPSTGGTTPKGPDRIPGAPDIHTTNGAFTERASVTASSTQDTLTGEIRYADPNPGDRPTAQATFDTFKYENAQHSNVTASLTQAQIAAIKAVEVPLAVVQDPANKNTGAATWTYSVPDGAFDFLAAGEILTLTYLVRVDNNFGPNNEFAFETITITITGTNDTPTVATSGGTVVERVGTGNTAVDTISGTVTFTDADLTDRPVVSAAISTTEPFRYLDAQGHDVTATLTPAQLAAIAAVKIPLSVVQGAGNGNNGSATWTYSIADHAFDFLAKGETLILNYVIQIDDGHGGVISTPISISINGADVTVIGTNDVPTIATTSDAFAEQTNEAQPNPTGSPTPDTASGTITFTDVDLTDRPVVSAAYTSYTYTDASDHARTLTTQQLNNVAVALGVTQAPGNSNNGSANWTYSVADGKFDFLAVDEVLTLTYTATVDDGHGGVITKPITITITGTNDTATIATTSDGFVELTNEAQPNPTGSPTSDTASGTISFADVDLSDRPVVSTAYTSYTYYSASHHPLSLTSDQLADVAVVLGLVQPSGNTNSGSANWTYNVADGKFDFLAVDEVLTLTYTATVDDGHGGVVTKPFTITITGTNDTATATTTNGAFTEMAGTGNAQLDHAGGSISFADADLSDRPVVTAAFSDYTYKASNGTTDLTLNAQQAIDLEAILSLTPNSGNTNAGLVTWSYDVADNKFDFLAYGEILTLSYTATVSDNHGGVITKPITVTIMGANDAPTVAAVNAGLTDTAINDSFAAITGTLVGYDADHGETATLVYAAMDGLNAVNSAVAGLYGSLTVDDHGHYNYVANASAVNALHAGSYFDSFTVRTTDVNGVSGTATFKVSVTGANDTPVVAAPLTNIVNEGAAVVTRDLLGGASDADTDETATLSVAGVTYAVDGGVASGTAPAGVSLVGHTLTVDPANPAFDHLAVGEHITIVVSYNVKDAQGATVAQTETITINGTNDKPVVAAPLTNIVNEGATAFTKDLLIGASDVDHGETGALYVANVAYAIDGVASVTAPAGVSLGGDGHTLTVDPANPAFNHLAVGEHTTIVVSYNVTDAQGATVAQTETITINGTNDAPVVAAPLSDNVNEGGAVFTHDLLIGASDVDHGQTATLYVANVTYAVDGGAALGTVPAGVSLVGHTLTVDPANPAFNHLAVGEHTSIVVSYYVTDAQGATVAQAETITINGTNDAPVVAAPLTNIVNEGATAFTKDLLIGASDVDHGETGALYVANVAYAIDGVASVTAPAGVSLVGHTLTVDPANPAFNHLAVGEHTSIVVSYDVTDAQGATVAQTETVTINGVNDAPLFVGDDLASTYHAGGSAVAIVDDVSASDIDSANYADGSLTVTVTQGGKTGDTLSIAGNQNIYTAPNGADVMFDADGTGSGVAVAIGTLTDGINSLTIGLNDKATGAAVSQLAQAIEFRNTIPGAETGDRTVTFTLHDGDGTANGGHDSSFFNAKVTVDSTPTSLVIETDKFHISEDGNGVTTVTGLYVADTDPSAATATMTLTTATGASPGSGAAPSTDTGTLADINETLSHGVTYNPGLNQPQTDSLVFTVADKLGGTDTVHFIFNQAGTGPNVTLTGTSGKDVIFATQNTDTLTGGAGADQFVFRTSDGRDTITDFISGEDHIDLRAFQAIDTSNIGQWLSSHAAPSPTNSDDMLITVDENKSILLKHVALLHANDFIVSPHA